MDSIKQRYRTTTSMSSIIIGKQVEEEAREKVHVIAPRSSILSQQQEQPLT
jgi:hypothetical protein